LINISESRLGLHRYQASVLVVEYPVPMVPQIPCYVPLCQRCISARIISWAQARKSCIHGMHQPPVIWSRLRRVH